MRINRICSKPETRERRYSELKEMLLERKYRSGMVDSALNKARGISREVALQPVARYKTNRRPVCVVSWEPRLPSIPAIQNKHWRTMVSYNPYLKEVFPEPPLIAFKRQKNIRDCLIRAKVPPISCPRQRRKKVGMIKCGKECHACPYIKEGKIISNEHVTWKLKDQFTCKTSNIVYLIECNKDNCNEKYIGETERELKQRLGDHKGYINSFNLKQPTGKHFNQKGHSLSNMKITVLEKVKKKDTQYRKEREKFLIRKFNTFYKGMNNMP